MLAHHPRRLLAVALLALVSLAAAVVAARSPGAQNPRSELTNAKLAHLSQSVGIRFWIAHPDQAPAAARARFERLHAFATSARARRFNGRARAAQAPGGLPVFNRDVSGLPQNEESVSACRSNPNLVLEGDNDYRFLIDPDENSTGWDFSNDGGHTVTNEGLLPTVVVNGQPEPSGGDPVEFFDGACNIFAADLNYDPVDPNSNSGIGIYRSDAATLASCPGGSDPACWPTRRSVADAPQGHFYDKPWIYVGNSGSAGEVVWLVFADFKITGPGDLDFTASEKAVRCTADLNSCTKPILLSGSSSDVQNGDVTIAPDGRTYITWSDIKGELQAKPQTFIHRLRIAPAGSTTFGRIRTVAKEDKALPFDGFLHADDFRISTYAKNEVVDVGGGVQRVFVVWDGCQFRPLGTVCEEPQIKLAWSDDNGQTWQGPKVLSAGGDNYFPTISQNGAGQLAVAWFTNRYDTQFHAQQDVELVKVDASTVNASAPTRLTDPSNQTTADPILGGLFIGDYIEVFANGGTVWTGYNANYRSLPLLGDGVAVPQQDNYLDVRGF